MVLVIVSRHFKSLSQGKLLVVFQSFYFDGLVYSCIQYHLSSTGLKKCILLNKHTCASVDLIVVTAQYAYFMVASNMAPLI